MLTIIVCSFPVLMIEIREKLVRKIYQRAHAAILPTDALNRPKKAPCNVLVNISVPTQGRKF